MPNYRALSDVVRASLASWLDSMSDGLPEGRFRFCRRGNLVATSGRRNNFVTCFAMKAAWQSGIWETWPDIRRNSCINFIQNFQAPDGRFVDKSTIAKSLMGSVRTLFQKNGAQRLRNYANDVVRAETRQAASTIMMTGKLPEFSLPTRFADPDSLGNFLRLLDWTRPWNAGSHAAHEVFFLQVNMDRFAMPKNAAMLETAFTEIENQRDPETGTWGQGAISHKERVNGAMKVLGGYAWTERHLPHADRLLDFALAQPFEQDGCGFLNRLYVIHEASKHASGYRVNDIRNLAEDALKEAEKYSKIGGGFSFFIGGAQTRYYGGWTSLGGKQGDMHGAAMLAWAYALCFELLGIAESVGWRSHKP